MPFYKVELRGGDRGDRYEFAQEFGLRASDHTGHQIVFYRDHPAQRDNLERSYRSAARGRFDVTISTISEEDYNGAP